MKLTRLRSLAILLFLMSVAEGGGRRPESILAELLTKPFVPRDFASPDCIRDSDSYLKALDNYIPWALQMYDASVKIPSGIITGNFKQLGNFDECLRVKSEHGFIGQACSAEIQFHITASDAAPHRDLDLGDLLVNVAIASNTSKWTSGKTVIYEWMWCVPSTCSHLEIQDALEIAFDPLKVDGRVDLEINVREKSCHTAESIRKIWDISDYCYTTLLALFALIIVVGTIYDVVKQNKQIASTMNVILTSFSFNKNLKNLSSTERSYGSISCVDGIRFLSLCWIIYGHTYYMEVISAQMNLSEIPHMHHDWSNMLVLNGNLVTDTFLLLSGMLIAYTELSKKDQAGIQWNFSVIRLYIHRYIRLTPAYAMMIGFYATLFYKFGTGPRWDNLVGENKDFCRQNWWINLIYFNNYYNVPTMCMNQSWYLSLDMQLTLLSPLVLCLIFKLRKLYLYICMGALLIISILVPFVITFVHQLTGTMLYYKEPNLDVANVYQEIYIKTYTRFGPYIIGIFLADVLHTYKYCKIKLPIWVVIVGWLTATAASLLSIFWPRHMYFDTYKYNGLEAALYAGLHRPVFVSAIGWIIFCCQHNYAGILKHLLSWNGWIPLSKLSYCAYLIHYVFIISNVGTARTADNLTTINVVRKTFANIVFTMMLSVLWHLCFEMPFQSIDRALFGRKQKITATDKQNAGFIESGEKISQSNGEVTNESSITCDDDVEQSNVSHVSDYIDCTEIVGEHPENVVEDIGEKSGRNSEKSRSKIDFV